jgi:hypothetical protein
LLLREKRKRGIITTWSTREKGRPHKREKKENSKRLRPMQNLALALALALTRILSDWIFAVK